MTLKTLAAAAALSVALGASAAQAKTLVYCSEASPEGFNPQLFTAGTTLDASSRQVYNRLVEFKRGTTEIVPGLAERWEISADGRTYTFHLRPDVQFHSIDGFTPTRPLTADDVVWSFERQMNPQHPYHQVGGGSYEYFEAMSMGELIERVEKVDDHTVRFHLTRPEAPMLANLAMDFASIFSKEYADAMMDAGTPDQVDNRPVGTGPFKMVDYQKDSVIRYVAHPDYWEGKAALDRLVFSITPDAGVRFAKIKAGECHVMPYPNPADVPLMRDHPDLRVMEAPGLNVGYLAFNTEKPPLDDPRVRRALSMAIDKDAIVEAVYLNQAMAAKNPMPPMLLGYADDIEDHPYDPEAAKRLLAEAGYPDGFATDVWAVPIHSHINPNSRRQAEMIQADWQKIGVTAEIKTYEWGEYLKRSKDGEHQTLLLGWNGDNGDPDNFLAVLLSCDSVGAANRARWCDQEFDAAVMEAKRVSDPAARAALYEKAQRRFHEQVPWDPMVHAKLFDVVRKEVTGYTPSPFDAHVFYGVDLKD
ncbi:MAG: ABC transporter substrate-binding protein [Caenispirillum bisanense]|nr:ABC transporter substrate-binding protein [Caenispirillum bisanense]MCA1972290.1 ABC transporter substrate-binding protein [Caenispirillum sp.]